jgi:hypothetical protein
MPPESASLMNKLTRLLEYWRLARTARAFAFDIASPRVVQQVEQDSMLP